MKIQPVTGPGAIPDTSTPEHIRTARAVEAFKRAATSNPAQEIPMVDPSRISPEELSAVKPSELMDNSVELEATQSEEVLAEETQEAPKAPKEDPALSRQFAQLARQEKALRARAQQQEKALAAKEAALTAREAAASAKDQEYRSGYLSRDQLKQDPLTALAEAGVSYEELTQQILTQQPKDPRVEATIGRLEAKIKALEEASETSQKTYTQQQQQAYDSAVKQISLDAKRLISSDPAYETIKATGSVRDVVELITQTYEKDQVLLSVEEAAQQVEDYLVEEAMKITQIDKIQKRLSQNRAAGQSQKVQSPATQKQQQPMKTLTNATSSQRQLSAKERAILAFKGELKA